MSKHTPILARPVPPCPWLTVQFTLTIGRLHPGKKQRSYLMKIQRDDWRPTISLDNLKLRSEIVWRLRSYFRAQDFLEVHTPVLSRDTVVDRHIDPISLGGRALGVADLQEDTFYLQTSPEFAMKRLVASGAERIYQIGPVFRAGERGSMHNPEFTMIEWYRTGDDLDKATELLANIVQVALPQSKPVRETYQSAFLRTVGICPLDGAIHELVEAAHRHELNVAGDWSDDKDEWLNLLFAEVVQPQLGLAQPAIITHYPASQSALARICEDNPRVAQRFELFFSGVELANGYNELLDADELSTRNEIVRLQRQQDGKDRLHSDDCLLAAMRAGMPPFSGCALGLDRLVMAVTHAKQLDEVICFPIERA